MIREVKSTKAGFVGSDANIAADATLREVIKLRQKTGHSTMAVTDNGQRMANCLELLPAAISEKPAWIWTIPKWLIT